MASGRTRQRKRFNSMPHTFRLAFAIDYADLDAWLNWVNDNAYTWFNLPLPSYKGSAAGEKCYMTEVRFTSDISTELLGDHHIKATVTAEFLN